MNTTTNYSPEIRERGVRMVYDHQDEYESQWAAIRSIVVQKPNPDLDPNKAKARLLGRIQFAAFPEETNAIMQGLMDRGIEPTLSNVQKYLVQCLTIPFDELPRVVKMIILRSGRAERFVTCEISL